MQGAAQKSWLEGASSRGLTLRGLRRLHEKVQMEVAERQSLACRLRVLFRTGESIEDAWPASLREYARKTYRALVAGRFTRFTRGDEGKTVEVKSGAVTVGGIKRHVDWGESAHPDCRGKIKKVETRVKGNVTLEDGSCFENCAILSIDELSTSALVSAWIKDAAVTGDDRLADRPECDLAPDFVLNPKQIKILWPMSAFQIIPRSVGANQSGGRASAKILCLACVARPI
jgi:hypothetical protein